MKKLYFLFFLILSICAVSAQEKLSKEEQARREKNVQAGNPFVKFGSKAPVATLSKGKYLEVHDLDSIVTIGTTRWQVDDKKIVGEIVQDSLNPDAQPIGDIAGHWMSPDPLSEEFPEWSPYAFVNDNPVRFTDPTGMAPEDCCDGLKGFLVGMSDNLLGRNDRSNYGGRDFDSGARTADILSFAGGTYLAAKGIIDTGAGASGLAGSIAVTEGSFGAAIEVTAPAAVISLGVMGQGMIETGIGGAVAYNAMSNLNSSKESGSYTNTHESGKKYHGKGDESRMNKSAKSVAEKNNDPVASQDHTTAKNSREGFKQESARLKNDGGHKNPNNYNKRDSPGTKYAEQDKVKK